ncbi:MAG: hypothetical protein CML13_17405 [Puniceicoccaceae bacterium]|nr:hypothetical protein [Puniceicoccaceae bacterium]|tara:strand:+ start:532 stop:813 length:282 start_codon:yes stop_codon:yes gene_type:complete
MTRSPTINKYLKAVSTSILALASLSGASELNAEANKTLSERHQAIIPIAAFTAAGDLPKLTTALGTGLDVGLTVSRFAKSSYNCMPMQDFHAA